MPRRPSAVLLAPGRAATAALLAAITAACAGTPPSAASTAPADAPVEPDVFDVIRASNSKQAVERLRDRYHEEVEHAKLLEARIGELIAAEEALSTEQHQRLESLQKIRDEVRSLAEQNAALEKQLAAEAARRDELKKQLGATEAERAAAEKAAAEKAAADKAASDKAAAEKAGAKGGG